MIFGELNSKFIYGNSTVDLPYSIIRPNWIVNNIVEDESIINGVRHFKNKSDHSEFQVLVYLFKYTNPTPKAKYQEIFSYKGLAVLFYPFQDKYPLAYYNGSEVPFYLTECYNYSLFGDDRYDVVKLVFKSKYPTVIEFKNLLLGTEDSKILTTEDGTFIGV